MSDLETDERLSAELKGAGWSLEPPDGAKDLILTRVAQRRRTVQAWLAGGATAVVVASAFLVWPAVTGETTPHPTPPAIQPTTNPPTHETQRGLPPPGVIDRLRQVIWSVGDTSRSPTLSRQAAIARARSETRAVTHPFPRARAWLVRASTNPDGFPGHDSNPAWLVQFPVRGISPPYGRGPVTRIGRLVLLDANSGEILLDIGAQYQPCNRLTTDSCPPFTPPAISTSTWKPGDHGRTALIRGTLRFAGNGCPFLEDGAARHWVVWPAGYRVRISSVGLLTLDGPGVQKLHRGDDIEAGGAAAAGTAGTDTPCIPAGATLTIIESSITRVNG